jgi:hypothetical protein
MSRLDTKNYVIARMKSLNTAIGQAIKEKDIEVETQNRHYMEEVKRMAAQFGIRDKDAKIDVWY